MRDRPLGKQRAEDIGKKYRKIHLVRAAKCRNAWDDFRFCGYLPASWEVHLKKPLHDTFKFYDDSANPVPWVSNRSFGL